MALSTDELDYMIAESPDSAAITYSAQTGFGLLDRDTVQAIQADGALEILGDSIAVWVRDGKFTSLAMDATITVGGTSYTIRDIGTPLTDGMRKITLVES